MTVSVGLALMTGMGVIMRSMIPCVGMGVCERIFCVIMFMLVLMEVLVGMDMQVLMRVLRVSVSVFMSVFVGVLVGMSVRVFVVAVHGYSFLCFVQDHDTCSQSRTSAQAGQRPFRAISGVPVARDTRIAATRVSGRRDSFPQLTAHIP